MKYNRNFAKPNADETYTFAPVVFNDEGGLNTRPSEADYLARGYYRFKDEVPTVDKSHYAVATKYADLIDGVLTRRYEIHEVPPPPPRVFSKLKAIGALKAEGVWNAVKAWIEANDLYDEYLAAQDFKEDNEYFVRGLGALKAQLGWSDEQVEAILSQCVAEGAI